MEAIDVLTGRGLSISAQGDLLLVSPRDKLTDDMRTFIRTNKSELLDIAKSWPALEASINTCCDERGGDDNNRQALIVDCRHEPASDWRGWTDYFNSEAAKQNH